MQDSFGLLMLIVFGSAGLISIFTVISLVLPSRVQTARGVLEASPGRSLLLGVINILCAVVVDALCVWLAQTFSSLKVVGGVLVVIGGLTTLALVLLAFLGLTSLAQMLGRQMGEPKTEFAAVWRGGALLFLAGLTPFIGWFGFTPLAIATGLGAALQSIFPATGKAA